MKIQLWITCLLLLIKRILSATQCGNSLPDGSTSLGIGANSPVQLNTKYSSQNYYPSQVTMNLPFETYNTLQTRSSTIFGAWIRITRDMVLPQPSTVDGSIFDANQLGLKLVAASINQDNCDPSKNGIDTSGRGSIPQKFLRPRGVKWVYYLFYSDVKVELTTGGTTVASITKFNEIYRSFSTNEEDGNNLYYQTSDKATDYAHFKKKTPLGKCFTIQDSSGVISAAENFNKRFNNLDLVIFKNSQCEFISIMSLKVFSSQNIAPDYKNYIYFLMGGDRLKYSLGYDFKIWDTNQMKLYFGEKYKTSQMKRFISDVWGLYGIMNNRNTISQLGKFRFKPFENHSSTDRNRTMGFTVLVGFYHYITRNTSTNLEETHSFDLFIGQNLVVKLQIELKIESGQRLIIYKQRVVNDDKLTPEVDTTSFETLLELNLSDLS